MPEIKINTTSAIQNPSLQVGDHAFYQEIDNSQPLNSANDPIYIGPITEIDSGFIKVEAAAGTNPNDIIGFLMFSKDKRVNNSDLNGYYAEVTFKNNDFNNASELFAISSEATFSSK